MEPYFRKMKPSLLLLAILSFLASSSFAYYDELETSWEIEPYDGN